MRFTLKRITPFLLYRADGREDLLCKGNHKPAEQAQEALGTLACVMALDRHTDLDDAPAEDNNADSLDRGKDEIGQVVDHRDRIAAGGKGGGAEADNAEREDAPHGHKNLCAFGSIPALCKLPIENRLAKREIKTVNSFLRETQKPL